MVFAWLVDSPWLVAAFFAGVGMCVLTRWGERKGWEADLMGRIAELEALNRSLAERCREQSELLGKKAEKVQP